MEIQKAGNYSRSTAEAEFRKMTSIISVNKIVQRAEITIKPPIVYYVMALLLYK